MAAVAKRLYRSVDKRLNAEDEHEAAEQQVPSHGGPVALGLLSAIEPPTRSADHGLDAARHQALEDGPKRDGT